EGLAPSESPRAMPGNQRAGQATAPTTAQQDGASPPGALVFTRAMVEGPLSQKRRKRAVAGTACNSPQMSVITGTAWTQTAPRRCGQWPRRTCEPQTDT